MEYQRIDNKVIVRLDRGDYIMENLKKIAQAENIKTGTISGIGAVDYAELNFFFYELQNYRTVPFEEEFEVLALLGNFTQRDNQPNIHLHITLGKSDYSTIGGHLLDARVSITLEIFIDIIDTTINRQPDKQIDNFYRMSWHK